MMMRSRLVAGSSGPFHVNAVLMGAVLVAVVAFADVASAGIPAPTENWFDQTVDHFNAETQPATFRQRYLTFSGYWYFLNINNFILCDFM
jgi:hypothetical protein